MTAADAALMQTLRQAILKNSEPRWGLTLVSFLAGETVQALRSLVLAGLGARAAPVTFAAPGQAHTTHLSLTRSQPEGPVRLGQLLLPGGELYALYEAVRRVTAGASPFRGQFTTLQVAADGVGLVLKGESTDLQTDLQRGKLQALPQTLAAAIQVEQKWPPQPGTFHCTLGTLREPLSPEAYPQFIRAVGTLAFAPVGFVLEEVVLVHHQYRTLRPPQLGRVAFPLGQPAGMTADEFAARLNLF